MTGQCWWPAPSDVGHRIGLTAGIHWLMSVEVHTEERRLAPNHDGVAFNVYMDGEKVQCIITGEALKSQFQDADKPLMDIFADNEKTITSLTSFLLAAKPEHMDGAVVINLEDLQKFSRR